MVFVVQQRLKPHRGCVHGHFLQKRGRRKRKKKAVMMWFARMVGWAARPLELTADANSGGENAGALDRLIECYYRLY